MESTTQLFINKQLIMVSALNDVDLTIRAMRPFLLHRKEIAKRMLHVDKESSEYRQLQDLLKYVNDNMANLLGI